MTERKTVLLRLDPAVHDALTRWAGDELLSTNAQIERLLRRSLSEAGRLPSNVTAMRPRGRPRKLDARDRGRSGAGATEDTGPVRDSTPVGAKADQGRCA